MKHITAEIAKIIQGRSIECCASYEAYIMELLAAITNQVKPMIMAGEYDLAAARLHILFTFVIEQGIEGLDIGLMNSYQTALAMTVDEEEGYGFLAPELAMGYDGDWLRSGKPASVRLTDNITKTNDILSNLLLGYKGKDSLMMLGVITEEIRKSQNEWLRLIRTEAEAAYSQGNRDALLARGAQYAVIENSSPCPLCEEYVGEHEMGLRGFLGLDLPPYHPNCQCIFIGIFSD